MPDRDTTRINERIRVPEVRLIDENGEQVGILPTDQALRMAQDRDLDLVEVAANSRPPVCRILDYSKYKYEQAQKQKAARKHQTTIVLREIKFRPKIAQHDYDTKKGHVERFLLHKDKVKITIMFRGREVTHPERGQMILERLAEELEEIAQVDQRPQQDGRDMTMMLSPSKAVLAGQIDAESWKARGDGSALMDAPEDEGITVEGPGEERSERVVTEPKPDRRKKAKVEAEAEAEPVADAAPEPEPVEEPVAEPEPEVVAEPEPVAEAPEPEPEPEAEAPKEEPKPEPVKKPKKAGPAPVSKAEAEIGRAHV
jgi:translation initiation factor IF-3